MYPLFPQSILLELKSVQHRETIILHHWTGEEETTYANVNRFTTLNKWSESTHTVSPARQQSQKTWHWSTSSERETRRITSLDDRPLPMSSMLMRGVPGQKLGIHTLVKELRETPSLHSTSWNDLGNQRHQDKPVEYWCLVICIDRNLTGTFLSMQQESSGQQTLDITTDA